MSVAGAVLAGLALAMALPASGTGQVTADQTRLSVGLAIGASSGATAWAVTGQPIVENSASIDTVGLSRDLNGSISAAFAVTYFPHSHWGISGEVALIGGRYQTSCTVTAPSNPSGNSEVCTTINQSSRRSSTVALNAGVLYRLLERSRFSPYLSARGGVLLGSLNAVETVGSRAGSLVTLYHDQAPPKAGLVAMLGAGFTAPAGPGYQFRWEVRDVIMSIDQVISVTDGRPQREPEHRGRYTHRFAFLFGFEVVLERSRGHRY